MFKDLPVYHGIVRYNKYVVAFNPKYAGMLEESMDRLLDINLKGTFFLSQLAARRMVEERKNGNHQNTRSNNFLVASKSSFLIYKKCHKEGIDR